MDYQDELLMDALKRADTALYEAWKKSRLGSPTMLEINRIQHRVQLLMKVFRALKGK